jgi:hypothetical protein
MLITIGLLVAFSWLYLIKGKNSPLFVVLVLPLGFLGLEIALSEGGGSFNRLEQLLMLPNIAGRSAIGLSMYFSPVLAFVFGRGFEWVYPDVEGGKTKVFFKAAVFFLPLILLFSLLMQGLIIPLDELTVVGLFTSYLNDVLLSAQFWVLTSVPFFGLLFLWGPSTIRLRTDVEKDIYTEGLPVKIGKSKTIDDVKDDDGVIIKPDPQAYKRGDQDNYQSDTDTNTSDTVEDEDQDTSGTNTNEPEEGYDLDRDEVKNFGQNVLDKLKSSSHEDIPSEWDLVTRTQTVNFGPEDLDDIANITDSFELSYSSQGKLRIPFIEKENKVLYSVNFESKSEDHPTPEPTVEVEKILEFSNLRSFQVTSARSKVIDQLQFTLEDGEEITLKMKNWEWDDESRELIDRIHREAK